MVALKILIYLITFGLVLWNIWKSMVKDETGEIVKVNLRRVVTGVLMGLAFLILLMPAVGFVPAGHRGVVLNFGAVTGRVLEEGLFVVVPVVETVELMDVQIQASPLEAAAASKDLQDVKTVVTPNWHVDPASAPHLYQAMRREYGPRLIQPSVREAVKATTAKFNAEELITRRSEVSDAIKQALIARVEPFGIEVDAVSITEFAFSEAFSNAIESKVTATQQALQAQNDLRRVEFEAQQRVARATAEAEAIRIQAESISKVGGSDYVKLKAVEKWDGTLPTFIAGGDASVPFLMNVTK